MNTQRITDTIEDFVKNKKHSGSIHIANENETLYKKCFGYADLQKEIPITFKTQFLAGSITKQFTAVAILKALYDKNKDIKAELNKSIEYYLRKEHEIWDGSLPDWASKVTIHQLLVHSSGITNYNSLPEFENQKFSKKSEIINFFKSHKLEFNPGEKFSYSNSGYYLLGIIIEEITQKGLDAYLEETFFKPLEMKSTFLPMHGTVNELIHHDARFLNLSRGYQYETIAHHPKIEEIKRYEPMDIPYAGGSLISTAEDLLKWNIALYNKKILPQSILKLMLNPYLVTELGDTYYGYGIEIMKSITLGTYYSHRGGIPGYRSILTYIPLLNLSIIFLQNIVPNLEKILPEIKQAQARLSPNLSNKEASKKLNDIFDTKYPNIVENRNQFEFSPVYEAIIKALEEV